MQDVPVWKVVYSDGEVLEELDSSGMEHPFKSIDWARVVTLIFESQRWYAVFDIQPVELPLQYRLMRRRIVSASQHELGVMMLVSEGPEGLNSIMYWIPDNTLHYCTDINCSMVRGYVTDYLAGRSCQLPERHQGDSLGNPTWSQ